ncbi:MAG TPA: helix-turn-helix domain-containing protein [Solirubrobacterales bacterium]|nr:helix-turn-helix domain-containing protein [Solirubrobacterales bacterium]
MASSQTPIGQLLREWRRRRRLSQLELALDAGISARHLSFIETGRSKPGREVLLCVVEHLQIPLRERNQLLLAAGHAPAFPERSLVDRELAPVRNALDRILTAHQPYPALAIDRGWNVVAANSAIGVLAEWIDRELLNPPINALEIGFHPRGLAPWVVNLGQVRAYFLERIERQIAVTADDRLDELREMVACSPAPDHPRLPPGEAAAREILTPLRLRTPDGQDLSFLGTVASFGFAGEVTTSELSIELLFPADRATAEFFEDIDREESDHTQVTGGGDGYE